MHREGMRNHHYAERTYNRPERHFQTGIRRFATMDRAQDELEIVADANK